MIDVKEMLEIRSVNPKSYVGRMAEVAECEAEDIALMSGSIMATVIREAGGLKGNDTAAFKATMLGFVVALKSFLALESPEVRESTIVMVRAILAIDDMPKEIQNMFPGIDEVMH